MDNNQNQGVMADSNKELSIVIINTNCNKYLEICLKSIIDTMKIKDNREILIYNNGCEKDPKPMISKYFNKGIRIISLSGSPKVPLPLALNEIIKHCNGKWLIYTNEDCVFPSDWEENYLSLRDENSMISPILIEPGINLPVSEGFIKKNLGGDYKTFDYDGFMKFEKTIRKNNIIEASGTPHLMTKEAYMRVGGYDPIFRGVTMSDVDFIFKLRLDGLKMKRTYNCGFYHFSGKSSRFANESKIEIIESKKTRLHNANLFFDKWGTLPYPDKNGLWFALPFDSKGIDFSKLYSKEAEDGILKEKNYSLANKATNTSLFNKKLLNYFENIYGRDSYMDLKIICTDIIENKLTTVVELGVAQGNSSVALYLAIDIIGGHLSSIDHEKDNTAIEKFNTFVGDHKWEYIIQDSVKSASHFKDKTIDCLFIDTNHSKELTLAELNSYNKLVKDDGVIYLHDYHGEWGVKDAIDTFLKSNPEWKLNKIMTRWGLAKLHK